MKRIASASIFLASLLLAGTVAVAQEGAGAPATKRLDETHQAATENARKVFVQIREKELETWLAEYQRALALATQAGDQEGIGYLTDAIARSKRAGYVVLPPPQDAVQFQANLYAFFPDKIPYHVARERCERMGGHLVTVETAEEEKFLAETFGNRLFWAGATDSLQEGKWVWATGRPFKAFSFKTRFNNADGMQHALVWQADGKRWEDAYEGIGTAFVCEWER